jgi:hypothetical protein
MHDCGMRSTLLSGLLLAAALPGLALAQWREPPRTMPAARQQYTGCRPVDGDTLACAQGRLSLRGVDTERDESGYRAAQRELQRRTQGGSVTVVPHHQDRYGRVVGDVYSRGQNVGRSVDGAGYSKPRGARR